MLDDKLLGSIIQCHVDVDNKETFVVGRLVGLDGEWFLLQEVSPDGKWNGLSLFMKQDIAKIETDSKYLKKICLLLEHRGSAINDMPPVGDSLLHSILCYTHNKQKLIGMELQRSGYRDAVGLVDMLYDGIICLRQFDEYGQPDGVSFISTDSITRIFVGDSELDCIELLIKL